MHSTRANFVRVQLREGVNTTDLQLKIELPADGFRIPVLPTYYSGGGAPVDAVGPYSGFLVITDDLYNPKRFEVVEYNDINDDPDEVHAIVKLKARALDGGPNSWSAGAWVFQAPVAYDFLPPSFISYLQRPEGSYGGYRHTLSVDGHVKAAGCVIGSTPHTVVYSNPLAIVVDWNRYGANQHLDITADSIISFTPPEGPAELRLTISIGAGGGHEIIMPGSCRFPGGDSSGSGFNGALDLYRFYYNGNIYIGQKALALQ